MTYSVKYSAWNVAVGCAVGVKRISTGIVIPTEARTFASPRDPEANAICCAPTETVNISAVATASATRLLRGRAVFAFEVAVCIAAP